MKVFGRLQKKLQYVVWATAIVGVSQWFMNKYDMKCTERLKKYKIEKDKKRVTLKKDNIKDKKDKKVIKDKKG